MRDILIETLKRIDYVFDDGKRLIDDNIEYVADYLLSQGAIIPPCKVGDTVYVKSKSWGDYYHAFLYYKSIFIEKEYFIIAEVTSIIKNKNQLLIKLKAYNTTDFKPVRKKYPNSAFGKTVFLTTAEAKHALNGGANNE